MENTKIIIYLTEDGNTKIETRLEDVTVWLTIDQMVELFQKSRSKINKQKNEVKRAVWNVLVGIGVFLKYTKQSSYNWLYEWYTLSQTDIFSSELFLIRAHLWINRHRKLIICKSYLGLTFKRKFASGLFNNMCKLFSGRDKGRQVFYRRRETQIYSIVEFKLTQQK